MSIEDDMLAEALSYADLSSEMAKHDFVVSNIEYHEDDGEDDYDSMEDKEFLVELNYNQVIMAINREAAKALALENMFELWDDPCDIHIEEI